MHDRGGLVHLWVVWENREEEDQCVLSAQSLQTSDKLLGLLPVAFLRNSHHRGLKTCTKVSKLATLVAVAKRCLFLIREHFVFVGVFFGLKLVSLCNVPF